MERLAETPRPAPEPLRELIAVVSDAVTRRHPHFRTMSLVGGLVFFFVTRRFRERVLAQRRPAVEPPGAVAYVKHMQDLFTHGLAAPGPGGARGPGRRRRR